MKDISMNPLPRHQCLIYDGAPSRNLSAIASALRQMLDQNHRCLYLNSPPMVAGLKSYLAAEGVDVHGQAARGSLLLSSDRQHLAGGTCFDIDRMMQTLEQELERARRDGYQGLWASGDITWEFGPERDFDKLLEYEWRLEEFMRSNPGLGGICQYHAETLPREILRRGLLVHPALFVNETLSILNPHYLRPESFTQAVTSNVELDGVINRLFEQEARS